MPSAFSVAMPPKKEAARSSPPVERKQEEEESLYVREDGEEERLCKRMGCRGEVEEETSACSRVTPILPKF